MLIVLEPEHNVGKIKKNKNTKLYGTILFQIQTATSTTKI